MSNLSPLNYTQFQNLFATNQIYFLDFYADWCGPCRMMSPVLESFASDPDFASVKFAKIDVDNEAEFSKAFEVRSIPAFFLIKFNGNGFEKLGSWVGGQDSLTFGDKILKLVRENSNPTIPQNNIVDFEKNKLLQNEENLEENVAPLGSNSREI